MREVCAGGEDILLSGGKGQGKRPCGLREQGREMTHKKVQVLIKILKNRAL
jgi:hypothetical protein